MSNIPPNSYNIPFFGLTQRVVTPKEGNNYQPVNQGVPNTTPRVTGGVSGKISAEEFGQLDKKIDSGLKHINQIRELQGENPITGLAVNSSTNTGGDEFVTLPNNGTDNFHLNHPNVKSQTLARHLDYLS